MRAEKSEAPKPLTKRSIAGPVHAGTLRYCSSKPRGSLASAPGSSRAISTTLTGICSDRQTPGRPMLGQKCSYQVQDGSPSIRPTVASGGEKGSLEGMMVPFAKKVEGRAEVAAAARPVA